MRVLITFSSVLLTCLASHGQTKAEFFDLQWGLRNQGLEQTIDIEPAKVYKIPGVADQDARWVRTSEQKKKVIVAVLDTGLDKSHPAFIDRLVRKESECRALEKFLQCVDNDPEKRPACEAKWFDLNNPEVDQDKNGYPLDCEGWSTLGKVNRTGILGRPDFEDDHGHGTHVAGIIAANPISGIQGMASNALILPVQVLGNAPKEPIRPLSLDLSPTEKGKPAIKGLADSVARGVLYAINSGAQVINFSMGWPESADSEYLQQVIAEAQRRGIVIVSSAGNDSTGALLRPCSYTGVICVASHGPDGGFSHFTNYGSGVDIAAPGTNILSAWPQGRRPQRFKKSLGFEFLSGTSQAAPFVSGAAAELLAQGVPVSEIYQRLMSTARSLKNNSPVMVGAAHQLKPDLTLNQSPAEKKHILTGSLDFKAALQDFPQKPVIVLKNKFKNEINWDRTAQNMNFRFELINKGETFKAPNSLNAKLITRSLSLPRVESTLLSQQSPLWNKDEARTVTINLILDEADSSRSQIPSELIFELNIGQQLIRVEAEIVVSVNQLKDQEVEEIVFKNLPPDRVSYVSIDENLDENLKVDYLGIAEDLRSRTYYLVESTSNASYEYRNKSYQIRLGSDDLKNSREILTARVDWNFDGQSDYLIGLLIDRSAKEDAFSEIRWLYFDQDFKLRKSITVANDKVKLPISHQWLKVKNELRPAWVGRGFKTTKTNNLNEIWENRNRSERPETRFYYLDFDGQLQSFEAPRGLRLVDTLDLQGTSRTSGRIPVLLAQNLGSENKPSFVYDFSWGMMTEKGLSQTLTPMPEGLLGYRNYLEAAVEKTLVLDESITASTSWTSESPGRSQRISAFILSPTGQTEMREGLARPLRGVVDSALRVRAIFADQNLFGAFVFTNSELQYHDLSRGTTASRSLERYTFYDGVTFSAVHFPIQVYSRNSQQILPSLYLTESSGFNRGLKLRTAIKNPSTGTFDEIISPARLRFKTEKGCRPFENPVQNSEGIPALDFWCGDVIKRIPLIY
ncbi:MAG: S8 family peptidase [Pseudobdellovibrionaceae bacterium]